MLNPTVELTIFLSHIPTTDLFIDRYVSDSRLLVGLLGPAK